MSKSKLKLVCKNDNPTKVTRKDKVLDKDELIAIDRASSIDFSNIENNKNFVKIDIDEYIGALDEDTKELFNFTGKLFDLRKRVYERIKNDILTFTPYIMLFDIANNNLDEQFIEDVDSVLSDNSLSNKEVAEEILDILDEYIY